MIDATRLKEALEYPVIQNAVAGSHLGIVRDAARLLLAAQAAPGEVEAAARAAYATSPNIGARSAAPLQWEEASTQDYWRNAARAALLAASLHRPVEARVTEEKPIMSALLRIVYQSFDAGGESSRSMRAQALEAVLFNISDNDDPAFEVARRQCDADPWAFVSQARITLALIRVDAQGERGTASEEMMDCYQFGTISAAPSTPSASDWEAGTEAMREACARSFDEQAERMQKFTGHGAETKRLEVHASEIRALPIPRRP